MAMGMRFSPDEPPGRTEPGFLARAWASLRTGPRPAGQAPADHVSAGQAAAAHGLSADDVVAVRFRPTAFREGYDQAAVDDFLDRVRVTLRERAAGRAGELTAAAVADAAFPVTRMRAGYDQAEVDAFLDRVVRALS